MLFDPNKDFKDIRHPLVFQSSNPLTVKGMELYAKLLEGNNRPDLHKLVRYAMAYYDKFSPLVRQVPNIALRKNEAALVSGYDLEKDKDVLKEIFEFEDFDLQIIAIEFLKEQDDMFWAMTVSNEQTFWEYQLALNTSITSYTNDKQKMDALNVKSRLMDECDRIADRVEGYRLRIFGDAKTASVAKQLKDFSPESIAQRGKNV